MGVIDWQWSRVDRPAVEVAHAARTFAEEDRDRSVAAYRAAGGPAETDVALEARRIQLLANAPAHLTQTAGRPHRDWIDHVLSELRALP